LRLHMISVSENACLGQDPAAAGQERRSRQRLITVAGPLDRREKHGDSEGEERWYLMKKRGSACLLQVSILQR
jgi:hypothetical protein